ncbi:hypothetical protein M5689_007155 [Euphorbia peplus]|nr:hypothetical protein M5689_007155 [Euphorbia peplus]
MDLNFKFSLFLLFCLVPTSISTDNLDQTLVPDAQIKCGSCPCVNPCALPSPSPPPPPPPPPKSTYCPPLAPPPPRFIYVTAVPGAGDNLYVTNPYEHWDFYSSGALLNINALSSFLLFTVSGLVHLIVFTLF